MSMRLTEEEAIKLGFIKDQKGDWYHLRTRRPLTALPAYIIPSNTGAVSKSERSLRDEPEKQNEVKEEGKGEGKSGNKFAIAVTAYRKRHLDPDNICPKWYIDELVNAGLIPGDSSQDIRWVQKRVIKDKNQEERTVIDVFVVE